MRIYKFNNENWNDLETTVLQEVASPERKLGLRGTHFQRCLAGKTRRTEEPQKETTIILATVYGTTGGRSLRSY